jgi:hypothetical protein
VGGQVGKEWSASYLIPSIVWSLSAAGFLVWHVRDPARHIDGWAITLLIVGFLPWLRTVFETVEFPGGGSVTWRKAVEQEQKRQAEDIDALVQFLGANFLTGREHDLLQRLARGDDIPVAGLRNVDRPITSLRDKALIVTKPVGVDFQPTTLNQTLDVTARGHQYLKLVEKLPPRTERPDSCLG